MRKLTFIMDFLAKLFIKKSCSKLQYNTFSNFFFFMFCQTLTYSVILAPKWRHFDDLFKTWTIDEKIDPYNGFFGQNCLLKKLFKITIKLFWHNCFLTLCPNVHIYIKLFWHNLFFNTLSKCSHISSFWPQKDVILMICS